MDLYSLEIKSLAARVAEGEFSSSGKVMNWLGQPEVSFQATLTKMDLSPWASHEPGQPSLEGKLAISLAVESLAGNWATILDHLSGSGRLVLTEGVIRNLNVSREVLNRISMIPGLVGRLRERLPPEYQEKINVNDTVLEPINVPFTLNRRFLSFPDLQIVSDSFLLFGAGSLSLEGATSVQTVIHMDKYLSGAMIQTANELQYLADGEGRITLHLELQGRIPDVQTRIDLQHVAQKLAVAKGTEVLSGLLQKKLKGETKETGFGILSGGQSQAPATQRPRAEGGLLGVLLDTALQQIGPSQGTEQSGSK